MPALSLRELAEHAGVCKATVSLALRDHPRISAEQRARIQALARKLGYRPDPAMARIAANGWRASRRRGGMPLAFVVGHPNPSPRAGEPYLSAAIAHAAALGYKLERYALRDHGSPERLGQVLDTRGVEGVVLFQITQPDFAARFPWDKFSAVACSLSQIPLPVPMTAPDFALQMEETWKRLRARGRKRIGLALARPMSDHDGLARAGVFTYQQHHGDKTAACIPPRFFESVDEKAGAADFSAWLDRWKPEVVVGLSEIFYWWIDYAGKRVPADIEFVSLYGGKGRGGAPLTGWDPRAEALGASAIDLLDLQIRAAQKGLVEHPQTLLIPPRWIEGTTLR
jgi:LacI family transcriptional regulator